MDAYTPHTEYDLQSLDADDDKWYIDKIAIKLSEAIHVDCDGAPTTLIKWQIKWVVRRMATTYLVYMQPPYHTGLCCPNNAGNLYQYPEHVAKEWGCIDHEGMLIDKLGVTDLGLSIGNDEFSCLWSEDGTTLHAYINVSSSVQQFLTQLVYNEIANFGREWHWKPYPYGHTAHCKRVVEKRSSFG